jgi:MFS family permease
MASTSRRLGGVYWRLWTASTISNLGDGVDVAALPLLAATLSRNPTVVAGLAAMAFLPWLVFALVAGALVDRLDRRRVMIVADSARAVLVGVIALTVATGSVQIWLLYVIAFALGINETLFDNAAQSILPMVVVPDLLETANGRQYAAEVVGNQFVGPPVGGLLFSVAIATPFVLDGVSFALSAILIATIAGSFRTASAARAATAPRRSIRAEVAEGVRWLRRHRVLKTLALLLGLMNLCMNMGFAVFVLFAEQVLGLDDRGYGLLLGVMAVGSVLGGLFGARIARRLGPSSALIVSIAVTGATELGVGLVSSAWVVAALMWLSGLFSVVWNVITVSLRQRIIPDELLGRVNSVYRFLGWGSIPIGSVLGGVLASAFGLRAPFIIGGVVGVAATVVALPFLSPHAIAEAEAAAPVKTPA